MDVTIQPSGAISNTDEFSRMHVVHVVRQYAPNIGGLEDVVRSLAAQQKGRFASLEVVTLDRLFSDPGRVLPSEEVIDGVEVKRIPFSGSSRYPIAPSVLTRISDADLVHVHAVDFFFDMLALSRFWHGKKLVATTHGGFFHTQKFAQLKSVWFNTLTRFSAHQYEALACCSDSDFKQFQAIAPSRVKLIENGVDIDKFRGASSDRPTKRLLALGRFSSNKRLDRVIDVLSILQKQDPEWALDIVGTKADFTKQDLCAQAEAKGVKQNFEVHVGLCDTEIRSLMNKSSFFVSASEYEGFGLVLIESMSAGLIPVVHPNAAFQGLAKQHNLIELEDYSRPENVAKAIVDIYSEPDRLLANKQAAMASAEIHSWRSVIRKYDQFYREAIGNPQIANV
jgi:alpha-1,3-mannosyltransferase